MLPHTGVPRICRSLPLCAEGIRTLAVCLDLCSNNQALYHKAHPGNPVAVDVGILDPADAVLQHYSSLKDIRCHFKIHNLFANIHDHILRNSITITCAYKAFI